MQAESTVLIPAKIYLFGAMMKKIKHALSCLITKINAEVQIKCRSRNIKTGKEYKYYCLPIWCINEKKCFILSYCKNQYRTEEHILDTNAGKQPS